MKIGIFDSGIGGMSVLHEAMKHLPEEQFIYYADTDHVPYGIKAREEVAGYVEEATDFLVRKGVKAIIIACNTATSIAIEQIRSKYALPILGMEPAVKTGVKRSRGKRVMVIATPLTVKEEKLRNLLRQVDDDNRVDLLPLPKLVVFAERGEFVCEEVEGYLREELAHYNLKNYSALVLGCTHFNYFKDTLRKLLPSEVEFIDGSRGTVRYLKSLLAEMGQLEHNKTIVEYYQSGRLVKDPGMLEYFDKLQERLEQMRKY